MTPKLSWFHHQNNSDLPITILVLSGPFFALVGNAYSDIWLVAVAIIFLGYVAVEKNYTSFQSLWFILAMMFVIWSFASAIFSTSAYQSIYLSLVWIRFPLFTIALIFWLSSNAKLLDQLMQASIAATLIMIVVLIIEKLTTPDAIQLYGTWEQSTKAGWYLVGIGLPSAMWLFDYCFKQEKSPFWAFGFLIALVLATFLSGQIFMLILMVFGIVLFFGFCRVYVKSAILFSILSMIGIVLVLAVDKWLYIRFVELALPRIPWLETSDYYLPWISGIQIGWANILMGVGPGNYETVCNQVFDIAREFPSAKQTICSPHPHQMYIQYFAETGFIGLALISACAIALVVKVASVYLRSGTSIISAAALAIIIATFWPISTYSDAFGQHANFFTWYATAIALTFACRSTLQKPISP